MGLISNFVALLPLLLLLVSNSKAQSTGGVFDVTTYDAKPNADITTALASAWKEVCASTTPILLNYKSKGRDGFLLEYVDQLTVSGTGVLVGQGKAGWEKNDYDLKKRCTKLPMNLTFDHMTITTPENSPNIDGTHMSSSKEINILNTNITVEDNLQVNPCEGRVEVVDIGLTYSESEGQIKSQYANVKLAILTKQNPSICDEPAPADSPSTD
ncbi:exopolygalacturonase-like [Cucumis melo var. makuwa]|uniref:Exopolygalacturonase-like n=1 Tax=Cucumis melo var. makuwa TaxID=1194695 RepID=A0A5D3DPL7_CUCMM|nr:exopolygalacturonase-like [Cucumis melo var. makuwa]